MDETSVSKYTPQIKEMRSSSAREIVKVRKDIDDSRQQAQGVMSRLKDLIRSDDGSVKLNEKADNLNIESRNLLNSRESEIETVLKKNEIVQNAEFDKALQEEVQNFGKLAMKYKFMNSKKNVSKDEFDSINNEINSTFQSLFEKNLRLNKSHNISRLLMNSYRLIRFPYEHGGNNRWMGESYIKTSQNIIDIFDKNIDTITSIYKDNSLNEYPHHLKIVDDLINYGGDAQKLNGLRVLEQSLTDKNVENIVFIGDKDLLKLILNHGKKSQKDILLEELERIIVSQEGKIENEEYVFNIYHDSDPRLHEIGEKYLRIYLENLGLDSQSFIDSWKLDDNSSVDHLMSIKSLEAEIPGASKFLNEYYGIHSFGRYPKDMLIDQYKNHDNLDIPYGTVMYPQADHNSVFGFSKYSTLEIRNALKDKYTIRIFECKSKMDLIRDFIKLDKKYNADELRPNKISFSIIGGHGSEDSIQFGEEELCMQDLLGEGAPRARKYFKDNATIILESCSTGVEGGIGQKLSEVLDLKVIAPKISTRIGRIDTKLDEDEVRFDVHYKDTEASIFLGK